MTTPSMEQTIRNQISAMRQVSKLHPHDWVVLERHIDTLSQSLTEAQGEIIRLKVELQEACAQLKWAGDQESALAAMREERDEMEDRINHDDYTRQVEGRMLKAEKRVAHLTEEREGLRAEKQDWMGIALARQLDLEALTAAHERVLNGMETLKAHALYALQQGGQRTRTPLFVPSVAKRVLEIVESALTSPEGPPPGTTTIGRQLPPGLWVSVQGVVMQTLGPVSVSEEDWHRIAAKMPLRDAGEAPEPSRGRPSHAPDCPCPQCAQAREMAQRLGEGEVKPPSGEGPQQPL